MLLAGETNVPPLPPGKSWPILPARPGDWKLLRLEINIPRKKAFSPPLDNGSLHLQDKTEKKKMMTKKGGQKRQLKSCCVLPKGPFIFFTSERAWKRKDPDNGFSKRGQSPNFLTHTYHWVYLKGVKAGTFTKALCQELLS